MAQLVFTVTWFLFQKKLDRVIILGSMIYAVAMIIGHISYEVEKYRKRKKELLDDLSK
jgi:hypothetical protein